MLLLDQARDFVPAFWACVLGGVIPCPVAPIRHDPIRWQKTLEHIDALLDGPLVITTHALGSDLPGTMQVATLDALRQAHSVPPLVPVYAARVNDPAVFVLTSGSTGNSKAVVLTHGNLVASMAGKNGRQRLGPDDVTLNWISFDHVAALLEAHLLPLSVGATQIHADSASILADPLLFLRLISDHRISMTFAPNFLFGQINGGLRGRVPSPRLSTASIYPACVTSFRAVKPWWWRPGANFSSYSPLWTCSHGYLACVRHERDLCRVHLFVRFSRRRHGSGIREPWISHRRLANARHG